MDSNIHTVKSQAAHDSLMKWIFFVLPLYILILQLSFTHSSSALDPQKQISQYGYSVWSRQNGLPANTVNVIIQTQDGYLWLGTTAGLLRFDGVRFEVIGTDTSSIENREVITALCETKDSSLWIGTAYDGVRHLKHGNLIPCRIEDGFPKKPIKSLLESKTGHLWIGSSDGLFEYYQGRCRQIPIKHEYITSIAEDDGGQIFVGTGKGVHFFRESQLKQINSIFKKDVLPDELITSLAADHQGKMWIGSHNGLVCWSGEKNGRQEISEVNKPIDIASILQDRHKNIWVGTTEGIYRYSNSKWARFNASQGLLSDNILNILEDQEGSIWFCTSEGLCRLRDVHLLTYTIQEGLVNNALTSILEGVDNSLFFLSAAGGGSVVRMKSGSLIKIPNSPPVGPAYLAQDGSIWTSLSGSLSRFKNDKFIKYSTSSGLPNVWISAITEDSASLIIYLDRIGVRRFFNGRVEPFRLADGKEYSSIDYVSSFFRSSDGILWIGTSNGLVKIQNGRKTTYNKKDGLVDDWIGSFFEDRPGSLWIGSPRGGITHYRDGRFIAYQTKTGLFTNEIYGVLIDDNADVWMSSPRGIGWIHHQSVYEYEVGKINSVTSQVLTTADGMRTDECFGTWQPSAWKTHDNKLWFATLKGAVMIDPKVFKSNTVPPPVYIEQVIVDLQAVKLDRFEPLQPGTEKIEFHYTALSYLVPDRVLFKYKLEGYDREWVEAGTRRIAYYTNLFFGKYTFRVMACNNDGVWNEIGASYSFEILPHFYQTAWFLTILLIIFSGVVFGIYRVRVWQLLQREKDLERRIQERTRQLEFANKELEAFSYSVSHDLRAPLRSVDGFSSALLEDYTDKLDDQGKDYLQRVRAASQRMECLIDDILNLSRVMRSEMQRVPVDLSGLSQAISIELSRTQPNRVVTFDITPDMNIVADRNLMSIVMENLIDNAWKFTSKHPTAKIEIGVTSHDGQKVYYVRDDGDGFDMAYASKLFGAFQRMHSPAEFSGTGIGLTTVRRIINRHGGQVWAEAEKDKGAIFYFTIPL